jgi:hypothetical protein
VCDMFNFNITAQAHRLKNIESIKSNRQPGIHMNIGVGYFLAVGSNLGCDNVEVSKVSPILHSNLR